MPFRWEQLCTAIQNRFDAEFDFDVSTHVEYIELHHILETNLHYVLNQNSLGMEKNKAA